MPHRKRKHKNNQLIKKTKQDKQTKKTEQTKQDKQTKSTITSEYKSIDELVRMGNEMWKKVKSVVNENPDFMDYPDKKKLSYFRDDLKYKDFMNEYPVMTRYMVCMGQYSSKAFRKFLDKVRMTKHPPPDKRPKNYMEDQWIRRQADYVAYLWEAYQKGHPNRSDRNKVWQSAYKNLRGEFDDFRNKYKEIEKETKKEKKELNAINAKELLERLLNSNQKLSDEDAIRLNHYLKERLYKRRHKNAIAHMMKIVPRIEHVCEGKGKGPDIEERPRMVTIVHADEEQIREQNIPDYYRLDKNKIDGLPIVYE